jgi:AcrR family transcriptional regulator
VIVSTELYWPMLRTRLKSVRKGNYPAQSDETELKDRRGAIVAALRRCMLTKGYAETRLTDLARAAGISVSHLLYYFPSKEAVLEEVCDEVVDRTLREVTFYRDEPVEERIHVLVDHVFVRNALSQSELGVILQLIALSLHRPAIRKKLNRYNRDMMAYLTDLFGKVPRQPGVSVREAADLAAAVWIGLLTNSQYDNNLDDSRARRLFRRALLELANIGNSELVAVRANGLKKKPPMRGATA